MSFSPCRAWPFFKARRTHHPAHQLGSEHYRNSLLLDGHVTHRPFGVVGSHFPRGQSPSRKTNRQLSKSRTPGLPKPKTPILLTPARSGAPSLHRSVRAGPAPCESPQPVPAGTASPQPGTLASPVASRFARQPGEIPWPGGKTWGRCSSAVPVLPPTRAPAPLHQIQH